MTTFGVFLLGGLQLFFTGLLGEYIMSMNTRIIDHPLVVEEKRIILMYILSSSQYKTTQKDSIEDAPAAG